MDEKKAAQDSQVPFLRKFSVFGRLSDKDLYGLSGLVKEWECDDGTLLAFQRDRADKAYFVKSGCLSSVALDDRGRPGEVVYTGPGEVLGLERLLSPGALSSTLRAVGTTRFLTLEHEDLVRFLAAHPRYLRLLGPRSGPPESGFAAHDWKPFAAAAGRKSRPGPYVIQSGEKLEYFSRRSRLYLWGRLFFPSALGLLALVFGLGLTLGDRAQTSWALLWILPGAVLLVAGVWMFLVWLEWHQQFLLLTDRFLIQKELDLWARRSSFRKIPLPQVQSLEISKKGFLEYFFHLGTVTFKSSAWGGGLSFRHLPHPEVFQSRLKALMDRYREAREATGQEELRQVLEAQLGRLGTLRSIETTWKAPSGFRLFQKERGTSRNWGWRNEKDGLVTYKKHPILLVTKLTPWLLGSLTLLAFLVGLKLVWPGAPDLLLILGTLAFLPLGGKIWWETLDWINDRFQISGTFVRAVHKKPLWFGEIRREAELSKIQEISLKKKGLWALIWDYGDLVIQTAGESAPLEFTMVSHPEWIQSEVFLKKLESEENRLQGQQKDKLKEFAQFVDVYHQAVEQGTIPRRSPDQGMPMDDEAPVSKPSGKGRKK